MRRRVALAVALPAVGLPVGLFLRTFAARPLPVPAPLTGPLPQASPPAEMAVHTLATGRIHRRAGLTYRGGSLFERRESAINAVLVQHPRGDLLIDTGFGRHIEGTRRDR
jgi:hypothetical protein